MSRPTTLLLLLPDSAERAALCATLTRLGCRPLFAPPEDGAVDAVLVSAATLIRGGAALVERLKGEAAGGWLPVVAVGAMGESERLEQALACGVDDFLDPPFDERPLRARLAAIGRVRSLHDALSARGAELERQQGELNALHFRLRREHRLAEKVFTNIARSNIEAENVRHHLVPLETSGGDLLLVARRPAGGQYVLLADFTGHGLAAALGALPVAEIFHVLASYGCDIGEIAADLNLKLREILPTGMFCAACLAEVDGAAGTLRLWNGGLPEVLIRRADGALERHAGEHIPLGVVGIGHFDRGVATLPLARGDRIYLYSDGVTETARADGELFGLERLEETLRGGAPERGFDAVREALAAFAGGVPATDDLSWVEVSAV